MVESKVLNLYLIFTWEKNPPLKQKYQKIDLMYITKSILKFLSKNNITNAIFNHIQNEHYNL